MNSQDNAKYNRLLHIYTKLLNGQLVNKRDEADYFHVNERSIQRDIEDIREYLDAEAHRSGVFSLLEYDRSAKGYRMKQASKMMLTNSEILAVCKILLDSRAFTKSEMTSILTRLVDCCSPTATIFCQTEAYVLSNLIISSINGLHCVYLAFLT